MISVIIATYNRKETIGVSIESVLAQTYSDLEIITVDDGSNDDTASFLRAKYKDSRIKIIALEKNNGATFARNHGLSVAKGEYIIVWDSDDILYPNAFETLIHILETNPSYSVASAPGRCLKNGEEVYYPKLSKGVISKEAILCRELPTNHKVRIARRQAWKTARYVAKNIDFLVNVQLSRHGDWYCHDEYLADIVLESAPHSLSKARKKTNLYLSAQRAPYLAKYLSDYRSQLTAHCPLTFAAFAYGTAIGYLAAKDKKNSIHFAKMALRYERSIRTLALFTLVILPFGNTFIRLFAMIKNR